MRAATCVVGTVLVVGLASLLLPNPKAIRAQPKSKKDVAATVLAYDGFAVGTSARSYLGNLNLSISGAPTAAVIGFDAKNVWMGDVDHIRARDGRIRQLSHSLLACTQPGSLGHWTFKGTSRLRRSLNKLPTPKSGYITLSLLIKAHDNRRCNLPLTKNHTTNFPGMFGRIGFVPKDANAKHKSGLSLGYFEDDLRIFAGGKSFALVEEYKEDQTYLIVAELKVNAKRPESIRGYWAREKDDTWTPAKINGANGGQGARVECWKSPSDMAMLEIHFAATDQLRFSSQASPSDFRQEDFVTWDEVRLLDGKAKTPIPFDPKETAPTPINKRKGLIAYWPFDEGKGRKTHDKIGKNHLLLKHAKFIPHNILGDASLDVDDRDSSGGSGMASLSFDDAEKSGLVIDRADKFTFSAWIRGRVDGRWGGLNDIITMSRSGQVGLNKFGDVRGLSFMLANYRLRLDMIHSVNVPKKDDRITVVGSRKVRDDADFHHVAVTYDGGGKSSGVTFYVDGEKDGEFSIDFAERGCQLTGSFAVQCPFNIGGRNDDRKDLFNFGFSGYIDEVGVFREELNEGEATAIYALAKTKALKYNLQQVNQLITLHRAGKGTVRIGKHTWEAVKKGALTGGTGVVEFKDGRFSIQLGNNGSGVRTILK